MMTRKILLADDSVTIQKVVELTFSDDNYQVQCVSNGKAAVQKLQEDRPDILLCDVIMPEMNGYDVAAFVKRNPSFSAIPVILLTGTFEPFDEEKARQSGADTYITKPFDSKMLVDKVEELLKRRTAFDSSVAAGPVQVFHSRTEFTIGSAAEENAPQPEAELEIPRSQAGSAPFQTENDMLAQEGEPFAPAAPLEVSPEEGEGLKTVQMQAGDLDLHGAFPEAEPVVEAMTPPAPQVVDLGPAPVEEIPESAFSDIVAPEDAGPALAVPSHPQDVIIAPPEHEEWALSGSDMPAVTAAAPLLESVSGAEDWGEGQTIRQAPGGVLDVPEELEATAEMPTAVAPVAEAGPAPEVVHDLTEQQSMVAEAQQQLDGQAALEAGGESVDESPFVVDAPEPITGAYEVQPTVSDAVSGAEEAPFQPEEGVETGFEVPPVAAVPAAAPVVEAVSPQPEPVQTLQADTGSFPTPSEQGLEESAPPIFEPLTATVAAPEVMEEETVRPASIPAEDVVAAPVAAPAAVMDRVAVEGEVRRVFAEVAPGLLASALPLALQTHLSEALPGLAKQHATEALPGLVDQAVSTALPQHVRTITEQMAPSIISEEVEKAMGPLVERLIREMAPAIIKEVAWEVIPELAEALIKRRIQELETEAG